MPQPILISRTNTTFPRDRKSISKTEPSGLLLSGKGVGPTPDGHRYFLDMLPDREWWQSVPALGIGQSIAVDMDAMVIAGLMAAANLAAGREVPVISDTGHGGVPADPAVASKIGAWLMTQTSQLGRDNGLAMDELRYFVTSGGAAVKAFKLLIEQNFPGRRFQTLVDIGCGVGFIPLVLTLDPRFSIETAVLVEPAAKYVQQGSSLWSNGATHAVARWEKSTGEKYAFDTPAELITSRQCLFRVAPGALPAMFERAWAALRPGGMLVICEMLTDDESPIKPDNLAAPLVRRTVLLDLLSRFGQVRLYLGRDRWSKPLDPLSIAAKDYRSDSYLVLEKQR